MEPAEFENLAINFYQSTPAGEAARATVMEISHDPRSICLFHSFLFNTHSNEAKFLSLQMLADNILFGWTSLSEADRNKIKIDLFNLLIGWCSYIRLKDDESNLFQIQVQLVHQLDKAIIQILLVDWPNNWPSFLTDFISAAKSHIDNVNENGESTVYVFVNSLFFLGLFSDQIRSNTSIVSSRKIELGTQLSNNFQYIYSFLKNAISISHPKIQIEALNAISCYFSWVDVKLITSDDIISIILGPIMENPECRPASLKCILSIVSRDMLVASPPIIQIFNEVIRRVSSEVLMLKDQNLIGTFVQIFIKFICLDNCALLGIIKDVVPDDPVIQWMIEYTEIVDDEILMDIVAMWHQLAKYYYLEESLPFSIQLLVPLQIVLCSRMASPVEFYGDKSSYDEFSETLNLLIKIHKDDILRIMLEKIDAAQFNSPEMMNWIFSLGAAPGALNDTEERQLLTAVFNILIRYASSQPSESSGEEAEAAAHNMSMITASFLYLAGQFHRFLKANRQFFDMAVRRMEECIFSGSEQLQLVSVHALKKLAISCGSLLIPSPFVQKIFSQFNEIVLHLPPEVHLTLFEAAMHLIKHYQNPEQRQEMTMELLRRVHSIQILTDLIPVLDSSSFLPPIESMIRSMFPQFSSSEIDEQGKKNFYDLFCNFIMKFPRTSLINEFVDLFMNDINTLLEIIRSNGGNANAPFPSWNARALNGFATIIRANNEIAKMTISHQTDNNESKEDQEKFENPNAGLISMLFTNVIFPVFEVIKENTYDYPTLRHQFFVLIQSFCQDCSLLNADSISTLLNFIFFGMKHPLLYISEMSMNCISNILSQIDKCENGSIASSFYEAFYISILQNLLGLLFDGFHSSMFSQITQTISHMLSVAASGKNTQFTQENIIDIVFKKLCDLFPQCNKNEIGLVSNDIVNSVGNIVGLRTALNDFMVASKQVQMTPSPSMDEELIDVEAQITQNVDFQFMNDSAFPE